MIRFDRHRVTSLRTLLPAFFMQTNFSRSPSKSPRVRTRKTHTALTGMFDTSKPSSSAGRTAPVILFATPPKLEDLRSLTIRLTDNYTFTQPQVIKCREFIFTEPDVIGTPSQDIRNLCFYLVAQTSFLKNGRLLSRLAKMGLEVSQPQPVTAALYQACLRYSLQARLAPGWNKAGMWFLQGRDFLTNSGYSNAIKMDVVVRENELFFTLEATTVKFSPMKVEDLDIVGKRLQVFLADPGAEIGHEYIASDWCFVLPSMKKGRIVNISHDLPEDSPFRSYRDLKRHWKNTYGYRLPESEEGMNFYQVQFGPLGGRLFTYPEVCLRARDIQRMSRVDPKPILRAFMQDIQTRFPTMCGCAMKLQSKAKFAVSDLLQSGQQDSSRNLSNKAPATRPAVYRSKGEMDRMFQQNHNGTVISRVPNTGTPNQPGQDVGKVHQQNQSQNPSGIQAKSVVPSSEKLATPSQQLPSQNSHSLQQEKVKPVQVTHSSQQPKAPSQDRALLTKTVSLTPHIPKPASGQGDNCVRKLFPTFKPKKVLPPSQIVGTSSGNSAVPKIVPCFTAKKTCPSVSSASVPQQKTAGKATTKPGNKRPASSKGIPDQGPKKKRAKAVKAAVQQ